ncbi:MAG TPA: 50S ribosomal protein L25 [Candidatus Saccharimonadales bacterium]|nr:50S ribosomal protein L25 [Candidatus Saccharimonadales bacterium]
MSTADITVDLEERTVLGKGLNHLRASGKVPAVIHDHGQPSIHVMADLRAILKAYEEAGKHHPVQLQVGKTNHLALIKDVDFEPVKHQMRHVVFQAIKQDEEVEAEIPVVFKEDVEIPAEKLSLLVLKQLDTVEVKALPKDLPDELVVDPGNLTEVGDHITVADIQVPPGVTILTELEHPIATVEMPKDQLAEADAAAAALAEDAAAHGETEEGEEATTETEAGESSEGEVATSEADQNQD